jgi:hypothetical protein
MRQIFYPLFIIILLISGCNKSEIEVVPNNEAPDDLTIPAVTIENYVNRTYILTLGREPSDADFTTAVNLLTNANLDSASRRTFLNSVFNSSDYRSHVYDENRFALLSNVDTADFSNWIYLFGLPLLDTAHTLLWPYYQYEIDRLTELRNSYSEFTSGTIDIDELQRRMCNNFLYDQINMGSANFVIATFQNLINRNPTSAEQTAGTSMVEGNNAILFLQSGNSKDDYLDIFTTSPSYFEGQVIFMYLKYLNRLPNTLEMAEGTDLYITTSDFTEVQKDILSTNEFIGL